MNIRTIARQYQLPPNAHVISCTDFLEPLERILNDRELSAQEKEIRLANYFNDVFHIFLGKLVQLTDTKPLSEQEENKLHSLLNELIRVKTMFRERK